jgi:hypothetical protein
MTDSDWQPIMRHTSLLTPTTSFHFRIGALFPFEEVPPRVPVDPQKKKKITNLKARSDHVGFTEKTQNKVD